MEILAAIFALAFLLTVNNNSSERGRCDHPKHEHRHKKPSTGYEKRMKECTVTSQHYDEREW